MVQQWRPHDAARIKSGRYAGLVGNVTETRPASVRVNLQGVRNGAEVSAHVWLKLSQVERAK